MTRGSRATGRGQLRTEVRLTVVVLFWVVAAAGIWRSQTVDVAALAPAAGVWPPWAFWPGIVLLLLILTQVPRHWSAALRRAGAVLAVVGFAASAIAVDALVGALLPHQLAVVNADRVLPRNLHRVSVAVDGHSATVLSPATSFTNRWERDSATRLPTKQTGLPYGVVDAAFARGEGVTVAGVDQSTVYPRVIPAAGQPGYLPWFPRTGAALVGAAGLLALGWAATAVACLGVVSRGRRPGSAGPAA